MILQDIIAQKSNKDADHNSNKEINECDAIDILRLEMTELIIKKRITRQFNLLTTITRDRKEMEKVVQLIHNLDDQYQTTFHKKFLEAVYNLSVGKVVVANSQQSTMRKEGGNYYHSYRNTACYGVFLPALDGINPVPFEVLNHKPLTKDEITIMTREKKEKELAWLGYDRSNVSFKTLMVKEKVSQFVSYQFRMEQRCDIDYDEQEKKMREEKRKAIEEMEDDVNDEGDSSEEYSSESDEDYEAELKKKKLSK